MREERIDAGTFLAKFVFPLFFVGVTFAGTIGLPLLGVIRGEMPTLAHACIGLVVMTSGVPYFVLYHFPLKQVWLGEKGLRISNCRSQVLVPYAAVESINQMTWVNMRYVIVTLATDTIFGNRFTFVPKEQKMPWPLSSGEDDCVIDLRRRIKAAGGSGLDEKTPATSVRPARSIMADDELDDPL